MVLLVLRLCTIKVILMMPLGILFIILQLRLYPYKLLRHGAATHTSLCACTPVWHQRRLRMLAASALITNKTKQNKTAFETHGPNVKPLAQSAVSVRLYTRWARPDGTRTLVEHLSNTCWLTAPCSG